MMSPADRDALITGHVRVVHQEVRRAKRHAPRHVQSADLFSAGVIGLVQSADRWRAETHVPFDAYARRRVRGAILDFMRGEDTCSRRERKHARETGTHGPHFVYSLEAWLDAFDGDDVSDTPFAPLAPDADRPDVWFEARDRADRFEAVLRATPNSKHRLALILLCSHTAERVAELVGYTSGRVSQLKQEARARAVALGLA